MGVKEESYRDWASQIVLVPKTDGFVWFFVDNRKGECCVEIRRISNAAVWQTARSAGYSSILFDTGFN